MGNIQRVMEKTFVFFGLLFLLSIPLAAMGMVSELAMFALLALSVMAAVGIAMTSLAESK